MAVLLDFQCAVCKEPKKELVGAGKPRPTICTECEEKEAAEKRAAYLGELQILPLPERIAKVEAWIYDFEIKWLPVLGAAERNQARF